MLSPEKLARLRQQSEKRRQEEAAGTAAPILGKTYGIPQPNARCQYALSLTGKEREENGLDHVKDWRWCTHPQDGSGKMNGRKGLPLGLKIVCACKGCSRTCPGYSPEEQT